MKYSKSAFALILPLALCCVAAKGESCIITEVPIQSADAAACSTCDGGTDASVEAEASSVPDAAGAEAQADARVVADGSPGDSNDSPCKSGSYAGPFAGAYRSHLTNPSIPIPIEGNVSLALEPMGSAGTTCVLGGQSRECNNVFALQNGSITGTMDSVAAGGATTGGFPYFCTVTGALDCSTKELVGGWLECTYCVGALASNQMACSGTDGVGGGFAGPMTADYDIATAGFVMGTWNGAEALAGNDGGSAGPNGGPISDYLSDSGVYSGSGNFGGSGTWSAASP